MSSLKRRLNKIASDPEFEENGSKVVESVQDKVYKASSLIIEAHEQINRNGDFKDYLTSKGLDGNNIAENISNLYDELENLEKILKEAADKAEY
jgi:hypothetical protein